jgi:hypothetical protein
MIGGGGIYLTVEGLPENTCELVKCNGCRRQEGRGIGKIIIENCLQKSHCLWL